MTEVVKRRKPWSSGRQRQSRQGRAIQIQRMVSNQVVPRATKELDGGRVSANMVRQVLAFRAQSANNDGVTFMGKRKVAQLLGIAYVDVQRADHALARVGLLVPTSPPVGAPANVVCYRIPALCRRTDSLADQANCPTLVIVQRAPSPGRIVTGTGIVAGQGVRGEPNDSAPTGLTCENGALLYEVEGASCETPSLPVVGRDVTPAREAEVDLQSADPAVTGGRAERALEVTEVAPRGMVGSSPSAPIAESRHFRVAGLGDGHVGIWRKSMHDVTGRKVIGSFKDSDYFVLQPGGWLKLTVDDDEDPKDILDYLETLHTKGGMK